jgi:hypothetical protein
MVVKPRSGVATDEVSETEPVQVREIALGDLTVWLSDDAINSWRAPTSGRPGGQRIYANVAIEVALTIRMVFHLPLRQTEGFLLSLAEKLALNIPIPDHTTLSRRLKTLGEISFPVVANDRPIHLLIDSTGLRIHVGNLRKPPKNRVWLKLHLAVDAGRIPALLGQIDNRVTSVSADGAYDTEGTYEAAHAQGQGRHVRVLISPRRDAQLSPRPSAALRERNRNIRSIRRLGRREWHKRSGFSRRSMVENTIYRYKTIIGRGVRSRTLAGQQVEVRLACKVLNTMTSLGMPDSYRVG